MFRLQQMRQFALGIGLACGLSGCVEYVIADTAVLIATDKLIEDHVISIATRSDCRITNLDSGKFGDYCTDAAGQETAPPPPVPFTNCVKELGEITCYSDDLGDIRVPDRNQRRQPAPPEDDPGIPSNNENIRLVPLSY